MPAVSFQNDYWSSVPGNSGNLGRPFSRLRKSWKNSKGHGKSWKISKHNVVDFMVVSLKMQDRKCAFFFPLEPLHDCKICTSASRQHPEKSVPNNFVQFLINGQTLTLSLTLTDPNPKMWENARVVFNFFEVINVWLWVKYCHNSCNIWPQVRHLLPRKKIITIVKRKCCKKFACTTTGTRDLCTADAHATNRLQGALSRPAPIAYLSLRHISQL